MSNNTDKVETYPKRKGEARARKVWWIDDGHDKGESVQHKLKYVALSEKKKKKVEVCSRIHEFERISRKC